MAMQPPVPKSLKLGDYARAAPESDFRPISHILETGSDAAAALLAVAQVDLSLEEAIQSFFLSQNTDKDDFLFGPYGPLSTMQAKMHLAYSLGVFGTVTRDDIKLIASVRNAFAHSRLPLTFNDPAVRDACMSLKAIRAYEAAGIYNVQGLPFEAANPRQAFINTCLALAVFISIGRHVKPDGRITIPAIRNHEPDLP